MQLFKAFFKIAKKNIASVLIYFIIYAVIMVILASTSKDTMAGNFQADSLDIVIMDQDQSIVSKALSSYLGEKNNIIDLEFDEEVIQDYLYYRYIDYALILPEGLEEKLLSGETEHLYENVQVPGSSAGYFASQQADTFLNTVHLYLCSGYSRDDAISNTLSTCEDAIHVQNLTFDSSVSNEETNVFYLYQYFPYVLFTIIVCGLSPLIGIFQKKELQDRTNCSSLSLTNRNMQLILSCILYSLVCWLALIILGIVLYGSAMFTMNAAYALLNSFVFLLFTTAFTFLISNFISDPQTVNIIANISGLGMAFLCGVFVPQYMLSDKVLAIGKFLPAYWYTRCNNMLGGLSSEILDMDFYWTSIGVQMLFALAILALTLVASKLRSQRVAS